MRENRTPGSARGLVGNGQSYLNDEEMRHTLTTATLAFLAVAQAFAEDPGIAKEFHGDWVCVGFIDPDGERHAPKEKHFLKLTADSMTRTSSEGQISEMPPGKIIISKTGELWIEPNGTSERFPLGTAKIEEDELHIRGLPERSHHHLVYKRLPDKTGVEQGDDAN